MRGPDGRGEPAQQLGLRCPYSSTAAVAVVHVATRNMVRGERCKQLFGSSLGAFSDHDSVSCH